MLKIVLGILSVCILFVIYMVYKAHKDFITRFSVTHEKIPTQFNNYRIFFIADVHRRKIKDLTLQKVKEPINVIFIGGDFIERYVPLSRLRENIIKLKQFNVPIYFVWGNNDLEIDKETLINLLHQEGVIILEDKVVPLIIGDSKINLIGFNYYADSEKVPDLDWEKLDDGFTILLTHKPSSFYELKDKYKSQFDLVLAGHTHGGQIRIVGHGFYENGGLFKYKNTYVIITEGYGYTLLPFRLQTRAECQVISLKSTF
ncbi:metallophosphoesterase [Pseudogracilibacillus sp. SE30717A]|uniref:metallophosphoesterase n=1 Tax=Pseudogracilibacillus sp. SE30717A TaxID=3098293 RepID=UPI00300DE57D